MVALAMLEDEVELTHSNLERTISEGDWSVRILIYRQETDEGWLLELEGADGGSTLWEDFFPTDKAALDEALDAIETEGLTSFRVE